jgi:hypothetical protein
MKRFVKFYVNYWVVFVIFVPIGIFVFGRKLSTVYEGNTITMLLRDLIGINGMNSYNMTWWFNKLIVCLYLSFPLLYFLIKKWWMLTLVLSILLWKNFHSCNAR